MVLAELTVVAIASERYEPEQLRNPVDRDHFCQGNAELSFYKRTLRGEFHRYRCKLSASPEQL